MKIKIKPLSANELWTGRRFNTKAYTAYEKELFYQLPPLTLQKTPLFLGVEIGLSNKRADLDNCLKGLIDILQKKYNFNDNMIYMIRARKCNVERGEEYINIQALRSFMDTDCD